jgi:chorismate mutase
MTTITAQSSKDEIIDSSVEIVDSLIEANNALREDRKSLIILSVALLTLVYLF